MELRIDGIVNGDNSSLMLKSEYEIRRVLHPDFLYSSAFIIETNLSGGKEQLQFILRGAGWGHGVGLCQIGALGMAIAGYDLKTILAHYYQASELINIYD
jgi:SpoIID/LytB domain protein